MHDFQAKAHPAVRNIMCSNKKTYKSEAAARKELQYVRNMKKGMRDELHVYECPYCFKFHLGTNG